MYVFSPHLISVPICSIKYNACVKRSSIKCINCALKRNRTAPIDIYTATESHFATD